MSAEMPPGRIAVMGLDRKVHDFLYDRAHDSFTPTARSAS